MFKTVLNFGFRSFGIVSDFVLRISLRPFGGKGGANQSFYSHFCLAQTPGRLVCAFVSPGALRLRFQAHPIRAAKVRHRGPRRLRTSEQIRMGSKESEKQPFLCRKTSPALDRKKVHPNIHAPGNHRSRRWTIRRPYKSQNF